MSDSVEILVTGDTYLGGGRVKELALSKSTKKLFGTFLNDIKHADISVTNLESPLIDDGELVLKTGPNLKSPIETIQVLKRAGFNLLTLANNHIMDYGEKGLKSTIRTSHKAGINIVGAGKNIEESRKPYFYKVSGVQIAFINIAENEFGTTTDYSAGAHALDPIQNYYSISDAKEKADFVFVIVHGGHENYPLPSPRMKDTYRFFVDAGANTVVGHHPHCYSGYELYHEAPIFYSLGNFLFDKGCQPTADWNRGYMVRFTIYGSELNFEVIPYIQNAEKAGLQRLKNKAYSKFENSIDNLNKIISDDKALEKKFDAFIESSRNLYSSYIEPHSFKYIHALRNRNMFPSLLSERKKRLLLNLTRCEAHRDILLKILKL